MKVPSPSSRWSQLPKVSPGCCLPEAPMQGLAALGLHSWKSAWLWWKAPSWGSPGPFPRHSPTSVVVFSSFSWNCFQCNFCSNCCAPNGEESPWKTGSCPSSSAWPFLPKNHSFVIPSLPSARGGAQRYSLCPGFLLAAVWFESWAPRASLVEGDSLLMHCNIKYISVKFSLNSKCYLGILINCCFILMC